MRLIPWKQSHGSDTPSLLFTNIQLLMNINEAILGAAGAGVERVPDPGLLPLHPPLQADPRWEVPRLQLQVQEHSFYFDGPDVIKYFSSSVAPHG